MFKVIYLNSIQEISADVWNQLHAADYPFLKHEFLALLESSGSVTAETGWQPYHLVVYKNDNLVTAVPLYIKTHSYGEYVFDWAWARAYHQHGLVYYPKIMTGVPFTPCTGPRILLHPKENANELLSFLLNEIIGLCQRKSFSGWHCLFPPSDLSNELQHLEEQLLQRIDVQFHWYNHNYKNWDDFVANLQSRKRKNILKERQAVKDQGISFETKSGDAISVEDLQKFYQFYCNTYLKRSGHAGYLKQDFFEGLTHCCADNLVLVNAFHKNKTIAAALFFRDAETLYGRYWGCSENYDFLHFETCYYQGIDYAIATGLKRFDGGAQGEHKIARGFEPQITYSNHWIERSDFRAALKNFVKQESESVLAYCEEVKSHLPFKNK